MNQIILVAIGGGLGAVTRHLVSIAAVTWFGTTFPIGTLFVNVFGSLLMGLLMGWLWAQNSGDHIRLFLATGILGGFTTFSAFSLDAVLLYERGDVFAAAIYVAASVLISIVARVAGLAAMRYFFSPA
ncbi:MAG: fluoride efflux transporter CrcB [Notoacmeibacter sp.]